MFSKTRLSGDALADSLQLPARDEREWEKKVLTDGQTALKECIALLSQPPLSSHLPDLSDLSPTGSLDARTLGRAVRVVLESVKKLSPKPEEPLARLEESWGRYLLAYEAIDEKFLKFIDMKAQQFAGRTSRDFQPDLVQEGRMAIPLIIERFDLSRDIRLTTYGNWWIRAAMTEWLSNNARTVRQPSYLVQMKAKLNEELAELHANGEQISMEEIYERHRIPPEMRRGISAQTFSLSQQGGDKRRGDLASENLVSAERRTALDQVSDKVGKEKFEQVLKHAWSSLDGREQYVLENYYGLTGRRPTPSLAVIGLELAGVPISSRDSDLRTAKPVTAERARQIAENSIERIAKVCQSMLGIGFIEVQDFLLNNSEGLDWTKICKR